MLGHLEATHDPFLPVLPSLKSLFWQTGKKKKSVVGDFHVYTVLTKIILPKQKAPRQFCRHKANKKEEKHLPHGCFKHCHIWHIYLRLFCVQEHQESSSGGRRSRSTVTTQPATSNTARTTVPSMDCTDCVSHPFPHTTKPSPQLTLQISTYLCSVFKEQN